MTDKSTAETLFGEVAGIIRANGYQPNRHYDKPHFAGADLLSIAGDALFGKGSYELLMAFGLWVYRWKGEAQIERRGGAIEFQQGSIVDLEALRNRLATKAEAGPAASHRGEFPEGHRLAAHRATATSTSAARAAEIPKVSAVIALQPDIVKGNNGPKNPAGKVNK